jgi:hypothetical protein
VSAGNITTTSTTTRMCWCGGGGGGCCGMDGSLVPGAGLHPIRLIARTRGLHPSTVCFSTLKDVHWSKQRQCQASIRPVLLSWCVLERPAGCRHRGRGASTAPEQRRGLTTPTFLFSQLLQSYPPPSSPSTPHSPTNQRRACHVHYPLPCRHPPLRGWWWWR